MPKNERWPARSCFRLALMGGLLWSQAARADDEIDNLTSTQHMITIDGQGVEYTVYAGRIPIRASGSDNPHAHMFFVAYVLSGRAHRPRPLTVLWNGGPGGSALPMVLGGQGPMMIEKNGTVVENDATILPDTDLLYFDAVGSGFSRITNPAYAKEFYQTRGDNDSFAEAILVWRRLFHAEDQPLYLGGISWGGYRVSTVGNALEHRGIHVSGEIFMSGRTGLTAPGSEEKFAPLQIVHFPRIAMLHGKLAPALGTDIETIERVARTWAVNVYLPALKRISQLTRAERESIAQELSLYSGLPLAKINRKTLVVTPTEMLEGLLADEKKKLVTNDMRVVEEKGDGAAAMRRYLAGDHYLRYDLNYRTGLGYAASPWATDAIDAFIPSGSGAPEWDYLEGYYAAKQAPEIVKEQNEKLIAEGYPPGGQELPLTEESMRMNPTMRVLVVNGRYDSLRSCTSTEEMLKTVDLELQDRIQFHCINGGHGFFLYDKNVLRKFNAHIRTLIESTIANRDRHRPSM